MKTKSKVNHLFGKKVHVDADTLEWGRVVGDATVLSDRPGTRVLVQMLEGNRQLLYVKQSEVIEVAIISVQTIEANARAVKALLAVNADSLNDTESSVKDLLTDLRHYADAVGLDFDDAVESSHMHWLAERKGGEDAC